MAAIERGRTTEIFFDIRDEPPLRRNRPTGRDATILPDKVTLHYTGYTFYMATVEGLRLRRDGTLGKTHGVMRFIAEAKGMPGNMGDAPDWLRQLIYATDDVR